MEQRIYMTPRQPFFVTAAETYTKYVMNQFGIVHFYQCRTGILPRYAVPDGCVNMVFCCDPHAPGAEICGTVLAPETVLLRSETCYFGVRFLPGYNPILGVSGVMESLVNHRIPFDTLIRDERMLERICSTMDFHQQIRAFLQSYLSIYHRISPMENSNRLILHAANLLMRSSGNITMDQLAEEIGYTARYINKCFRSEVGLSPKQLAKIFRFQATVQALNHRSNQALTEVAVDLGYYDQSHFIHEFKTFSGMTPKKYCLLLQNTQYEKKLKILDHQTYSIKPSP